MLVSDWGLKVEKGTNKFLMVTKMFSIPLRHINAAVIQQDELLNP